MNYKMFLTITLLASMTFLQGCASIFAGLSREVSFSSTPEHANVKIVDGDGQVAYEGTTPFTTSLKRSRGFFKGADYTVLATIPGSSDKTELQIAHTITPWYWGNILFGGVIGMLIVDPITGAMWDMPGHIHIPIDEPSAAASPESTHQFSIITLDQVPEHLRGRLVRLN